MSGSENTERVLTGDGRITTWGKIQGQRSMRHSGGHKQPGLAGHQPHKSKEENLKHRRMQA